MTKLRSEFSPAVLEALPAPDAPRVLRFSVLGDAQTKGSAKAFVPFKWAKEAVARGRSPRAVIVNDNPAAKKWEGAIAAGALAARVDGPLVRGELFAGAVIVDLAFMLPRPLRLRAGQVTHTTRPDVDKLARCVLDGLTGTVYADDGQVAGLRISKQYAGVDDRAGVAITVTEASPTDPAAPPLFT